MSQSLGCMRFHTEYVQVYSDGLWVCQMCAAKNERAHDLRSMMELLKLNLGIPSNERTWRDGHWVQIMSCNAQQKQKAETEEPKKAKRAEVSTTRDYVDASTMYPDTVRFWNALHTKWQSKR